MKKIFLTILLLLPSITFGGGFDGYKTDNPTIKRMIEMYEALECDYMDVDADYAMNYSIKFREHREVLCSTIIEEVNSFAKSKIVFDKNSDE